MYAWRPLPNLLAHKIPHFVRHLAGNAARDDGRASRRQLVQHAHVQIAVERERQRARNRRGGHHQHIRLAPDSGFLHQLEALHHAETVLLVHHHQAQPVELDLLFNQRVRADDQLRLAAIDLSAGAALAVLGERAGQQRNRGSGGEERSSSLRTARKCCVARISVGAISAAW